jgi:hypothetical protein
MSSGLIKALQELLALEDSILSVVLQEPVERDLLTTSSEGCRILGFAHNWQRLLEFKSIIYARLRQKKDRPISVGEVVLLRTQIKAELNLRQIQKAVPRKRRFHPSFLEFEEPPPRKKVVLYGDCEGYASLQLKSAFEHAKSVMFKHMANVKRWVYEFHYLGYPGIGEDLSTTLKAVYHDYREIVSTTLNVVDSETHKNIDVPVHIYAGPHNPALLRPQLITQDSYPLYVFEVRNGTYEDYLEPLIRSGFFIPSYVVIRYMKRRGVSDEQLSPSKEWIDAVNPFVSKYRVP